MLFPEGTWKRPSLESRTLHPTPSLWIWGEVLSFGEVRGVLSCVWWLEASAETVELLEQKSDVMLAGVSWAERTEELLTLHWL